MSAANWQSITLSGRLLVEASAGTGKTWTMAALYLRLLLDDDGRKPLAPEHIVVSTFTVPAAQELSQRLRDRVEEALSFSLTDGGEELADPVLTWLTHRWRGAPDARARDRTRLLAARAQMDRAPIGTLHSLCQRILQDHPLEPGLGFQKLRLTEGRALRERLARDLLRRVGAGDGADEAGPLPAACRTLDGLSRAISVMLQPGAVVEAPPSVEALRAMIDAPTRAAVDTLAQWDGNYNGSSSKTHNAAVRLAGFLAGDDACLDDVVELLVGADAKRNVLAPARKLLANPDFISAITAFSSAAIRAGADRRFWAYWAPRLKQAESEQVAQGRELSFDGLIERVRRAVQAEGATLPDALFARWPVALVDEFQDTDGAQYALLNRWFRDADGQPRGLLAMVGDPKQAIYSFRGGDIGTYLRAADEATEKMTLGVNQRSTAAYVDACNAWFDGDNARLSTAGSNIVYDSVVAAGRADSKRLHERGHPVDAPLVLHRLADALPNAQARPLALDACASLVVELLEPGRYALGEVPLAPGDIAVLVGTNAELSSLARRLSARGVPCVGQAKQTVFDSPWARDLLLVLHAVRHPGQAGALRAALLTPLFGITLSQLPQLSAGGALDAERERFLKWREQWDREGVLACVHALIRHSLPALSARDDGERAVTDLRHLGELLQAEAHERQSPQALLGWMRGQREDDDESEKTSGERALRLESDARRVRLMTVHASKGLEFPVVLLPTLWAMEQRRQSGPALASGDEQGLRAALFEKGAFDELKSGQQDERFRQLYVALTRAAQACHVFVLPHERPQQSNMPKARTDPERSALDASLARWPGHAPQHPCIALREGWATSTERWQGAVDAPTSEEAPPEPARAFTLPRRYSFSALTGHGERLGVEPAPADDERELDVAAPAVADGDSDSGSGSDSDVARAQTATTNIDRVLSDLAPMKGRAFGNALHELLENYRSDALFAATPDAVRRALERRAVGCNPPMPLDAMAARIADMLDRALDAPLPVPGLPRTLRQLAPSERRAEMGFDFALGDTPWAALRELAVRCGEPRLLPELPDGRMSGLMTGSIDLVFEHDGRAHALDYKGNQLADADAAAPQALVQLMDAHHYRFQALLYTVALHRLLGQRLGARYRREQHLGDPIYVFLRAAGLGPGLGFWTQTFAGALIEGADRLLAGGSA